MKRDGGLGRDGLKVGKRCTRDGTYRGRKLGRGQNTRKGTNGQSTSRKTTQSVTGYHGNLSALYH